MLYNRPNLSQIKRWAESFFAPPRRWATLAALLMLTALLLVWWQSAAWYRAQLLTHERAQVLNQLSSYRNALTVNINSRFARVEGLKAFVEASPSSDHLDLHFESFATGLYVSVGGIRNLVIAPGAVNRYVYPLKGNEAAVGHNLLIDPRPEVGDAVRRAMTTRRIVLTGPYELLQGGQGLVARQAIFRGDEFWGIVSMVLDVPPILEDAGLNARPATLDAALQDSAGQVFYGKPSVVEGDPVILSVPLPEGEWEIAGHPADGWDATIQPPLRLFQTGGLTIVALAVVLTYASVARRARLEMAVQERTTELMTQVAARRQAEIELRASEESARMVIAQAADGIMISDPNGNCLDANPTALAMLGYTLEELRQISIRVLIPAEDIVAVPLRFDELRAGTTVRIERRLRRKDGTLIPVEISARMLADGRLQGIVRDITERKRAEEALRESESRWQSLVQNAPDTVTLVDRRAKILLINRVPPGVPIEAVIGSRLYDFITPENQAIAESAIERAFSLGESQEYQVMARRVDGAMRWFDNRVGIVRKDAEAETAIIITTDITERKRAEEALRASEARYRTLFEHLPDGILIADQQSFYLDANPSMCRMLDYTSDELIGLHAADIVAPLEAQHIQPALDTILAHSDYGREWQFRRKDHSRFAADVSAIMMPDGNLLAVIRDITERKRAETALRESEERYRGIFDGVQDAIFVESLDRQILDVNTRACELYGYSRQEFLTKTVTDLVPAESRIMLFDDSAPHLLPEHPVETVNRRADGSLFPVEVSGGAQTLSGNKVLLVVVRDISERKRAEQALQESEARFRRLSDATLEGIVIHDQGTILDGNQSLARMFGYELAEIIGKRVLDFTAPASRDFILKHIQTGYDQPVEAMGLRKNGVTFPIQVHGRAISYRGQPMRIVAIRDITERKRAEAALVASEARLAAIVDAAMDGIITADAEQRIVLLNPAAALMFGYPTAEVAGKPLDMLLPERFRNAHRGHVHTFGETGVTTRAMGQAIALSGRRANGEEFPIEVAIARVEASGQKLYAATVRDITQRQRAEREIQHRVEQLQTLREIDRAISASLDLGLTLNVIVAQVRVRLGVDAAAVLLLEPVTQQLRIAIAGGFRARNIEGARLRLGEGYAGRVAQARRPTFIPDLLHADELPTRPAFIADEGFVAYHGVPLIAKGQVLGVLEIYHRAPLMPDEMWLNFAESVAGQAAIAIDNAALFNNLQRSNLELHRAYDATIEGWSRALDLRDKETEGHTRRVTELTLRLARALGLDGAELVHVRRGALLHDIGKMGIPDAILHKSAALTDAEWKVMRRHPMHAYELLAPITYLRLALDIPYCHHEKWDGTGYPRGLAGEQIPLAGRLFAVVDVWDALNSNRPYRPAWSADQARQYLRDQAGKHFDPAVIEVFLRLLETPKIEA